MKTGQSVPKRRHIKFRRRGITQKITYKILNQFTNYCAMNKEISVPWQKLSFHISRVSLRSIVVTISTSYF
jgi:hypothetical protein